MVITIAVRVRTVMFSISDRSGRKSLRPTNDHFFAYNEIFQLLEETLGIFLGPRQEPFSLVRQSYRGGRSARAWLELAGGPFAEETIRIAK